MERSFSVVVVVVIVPSCRYNRGGKGGVVCEAVCEAVL